MKTIKISKVYRTFDEFVNSPEFNDMWEGWQGQKTHVAGMKRAYKEFFGCFVEQIDPEKNYGKSYRLYNHYQTDDGCRFLQEVSITTCLSIHSLSPVYFLPNEIVIAEPTATNEDRKQMIDICKLGITLF